MATSTCLHIKKKPHRAASKAVAAAATIQQQQQYSRIIDLVTKHRMQTEYRIPRLRYLPALRASGHLL
jgi:hypothetical protein